MSTIKTATKDKVPVGQKAAFGAGHLINNLIPGILGVFVVILKSADGFGMDTVLAGLIVGIPRLFDAITDPVMGYISDNTSSKFGRRRPYIFTGAILSGIIFMILWQVHDTNP